MAKRNRNISFYSELVIVTVLSLVAANVWIRWLTTGLNRYFPGSLTVDFIVGIIMTIIAIVALHVAFSSDEDSKVAQSPNEDSKVSQGPYDDNKNTGLPESRHQLYGC